VFWGFVVGGTSGAGIILLSLLMAVGLPGRGRDCDRRGDLDHHRHRQDRVFGVFGAVTAEGGGGGATDRRGGLPGAFLAKALVERLPVHVHTAILDAVVITGGLLMVLGAFR
jgi:hypothetical protein